MNTRQLLILGASVLASSALCGRAIAQETQAQYVQVAEIEIDPAHIRVFEIYRDTDAYKSHLQSDHFRKYKATTENMVKSLKLVQTTPIMIVAKAR